MADYNVEEVVTFRGDASQLVTTFEQLVNEITKTREELKLYRDDKEKSAELSQKLADQEMELVKLMKENNNVVDASNVSYRQLNDILKDLNKTYRTTSDSAQRMNIAPASKALNSELKAMDAQIGNYQRNVGNYAGDIDKAFSGLQMQTSQLLREMPSLTMGIQQFFLAISNNLPMFVDAVKRYNDLSKARRASAADAEIDALAHRTEATETAESTVAHEGETKAVTASASAHLKEAQAAVDAAKSEKILAEAEIAEIENRRKGLYIQKDQVANEKKVLEGKIKNIGATKSQSVESKKLHQLQMKEVAISRSIEAANADLGAARNRLTAANERLTIAEKNLTAQQKAQAAGGALKAIVKTLFSWQTAILLVIMALTLWGKDLVKWLGSLKLFGGGLDKATKIQKEFNKTMRTSAKEAASNIVELQLYSKWATMASKSDNERRIAAKQTLELMGSAVTETNIAAVMNGDYADSIDRVTEALIKQAQAEAMLKIITEKYKPVMEAAARVADARAGKLDAQANNRLTFDVMNPTQTRNAMDNAHEGSIQRAESELEKVQKNYENWLNHFLETFNPSEMLFGKNGGSNTIDNWFNKWEVRIKQAEVSVRKFQGEYENFDFSSIWKYTEEGKDMYIKMFDENIRHYKKDTKAYKEALIAKQKYLNEYEDYHTKLTKQYAVEAKTEWQAELDGLEEWYEVQKKIYASAGTETNGLDAEYARRKEAIDSKYVTQYKNIMDQKKAYDKAALGDSEGYYKAMMDYELKNLQDTMDKEMKEYEKKGIATTELEEYYAQQRAAIVSKYAKQETEAILAEIQNRQERYQRIINYTLSMNNMEGPFGAGVEKTYASIGGTTITGRRQRENEINAKQSEFNVWKQSAEEQIAAMESVLDSDKLIGEERLEMEAQVAQAREELALKSAEYRMEINQMELDNTRQSVDEFLNNTSSSFGGLEQIFGNVYSAIEKNYEYMVKTGQMTEEEAEKKLEEHRKVEAAQAAMGAIAGAVDTYRSLAGIPTIGPVLGAMAAASALAAGFANVRLIQATTKDNIYFANSQYEMPKLTGYQPQYVSNITGRDDTDYLRNSLDEKPLKAYVVESEATAAQEVANKRERETTW